MLFFYLILTLLLGSGVAIYIYTTSAYKIYDSRYDIPYRSGFDKQNCQIDRSCWVNSDRIKPRPPFIGQNNILLKSNFIDRELPDVFFSPNYGRNAFPN